MEKVHKYEEDLEKQINLRSKLNKGYEQFHSNSSRFLIIADLLDGEITYESPKALYIFMMDEVGVIERILNFGQNTHMGFCFKTIEEMFYEIAPKYKINNIQHFLKVNKSIMSSKDVPLIKLWVYIVKFKIFCYEYYVNRVIGYLNTAYDSFSKYYNLFVRKSKIPEELLDEVTLLMLETDFDVFRYDEKNNNEPIEKYIESFKEYTENHNRNLKESRVVVIGQNSQKREKNQKNMPDDNVAVLEDKKIEEQIKKEYDRQEIDNWVSAYLPSLYNLTEITDLSKILPQPYLNNYDQIMLGLLNGFNKYCEEKGSSSMIDFQVYSELQVIVESLKI